MTPNECNQQNPNYGETMQDPISSTNESQGENRAEGEIQRLKETLTDLSTNYNVCPHLHPGSKKKSGKER